MVLKRSPHRACARRDKRLSLIFFVFAGLQVRAHAQRCDEKSPAFHR